MYSKPLQDIIDSISKIPSIGPRQATRIAFFFLNSNKVYLEKFSKELLELKNKIKLCPECFLSTENDFCKICSDKNRDENIICIVQREIEINNIESSGAFNGRYFIIGDQIDVFNKKHISLNIIKLKEKIEKLQKKSNNKIEIILATNPTTEGDAISEYLIDILKKYDNLKISHLGRGLSFGGDLEYTDRQTLLHAFKNRN